jgi:hypothetical protein
MMRWVDYEHAYADLSSLPPEQRLPRLLLEYGGGGLSLSIDDLRRLFLYVWPDGARTADQNRDVLVLLRWIAPVRDVESYLSGTHIVYRGNAGNEDGVRWTLSERAAREEWGDDIVRGEVESNEILAHFTGDGQDDVLVDPDDVFDVRPV